MMTLSLKRSGQSKRVAALFFIIAFASPVVAQQPSQLPQPTAPLPQAPQPRSSQSQTFQPQQFRADQPQQEPQQLQLPALQLQPSSPAAPVAAQPDPTTNPAPAAPAPSFARRDSSDPFATARSATGSNPTAVVDTAKRKYTGVPGYDVVLDVPNVSVDEVVLDVDGVNAHVALDARVAKLVELSAGADVAIQRVYLGIRGVQAEAHLMVDLDNVAHIVDRVLQTVDNNPEIISGLYSTLNNTVSTVGSVANNALQPGGVVSEAVRTVGGVANTALQPGGVVSQAVNTVGGVAQTALQPGGVASQLVGAVGGTLNNLTGQGGLLSVAGVNALGNTIARTVDASGRLVEVTLDGTGKVVSQTGIGNVLNLPAVAQTLNPATGQILKTVQDASGALIQVTLDNAGKVLGTTVLPAAGAAGQLVGGVASQVPNVAGQIVNQVPSVAGQVVNQIPNVAGQVANQAQGVVGQVSGAVGGVTGAVGGARVGNLVGPAFPSNNPADNVVSGLLGGVQQLVLSSTLNNQGQAVQQVVSSAGAIVERVINAGTGQIISTRALGNVLTLPVVREQLQGDGSLLRVVRQASGGLLELTIGPNGVLQMVKPIAGSVKKTGKTAAKAAVDATGAVIGANGLVNGAGAAVSSVSSVVANAEMVIGNTVDENGHAVQRVVDQLGNITDRKLNASGQQMIKMRRPNARLLPLVRESVDQAGNTLRVVRDTSGALLELTFGTDGKLAGVKVAH